MDFFVHTFAAYSFSCVFLQQKYGRQIAAAARSKNKTLNYKEYETILHLPANSVQPVRTDFRKPFRKCGGENRSIIVW